MDYIEASADYRANGTAPHAWVGCLACYNDGTLTGQWVDGIHAGEFVPCPISSHEEFWVMDFENYGDALKSETSPSHAQAIAEGIGGIESWCEDNGYSADAFREWLGMEGYNAEDWESRTDDFTDSYAGEYDSIEDYAYSYAEECGMLDELPAWAQPYASRITDALANDMRCGGEIYTIGRHVFRSY